MADYLVSVNGSDHPAVGVNFAAWDHTTLARFAQEVYDKLKEQDAMIRDMEEDMKKLLVAYRQLLRTTS